MLLNTVSPRRRRAPVCLSALVRWFPAFQHFADCALGVLGGGGGGGGGTERGGEIRLGLVELSSSLPPPFCSRRITLPSFRLLSPLSTAGGRGSVPGATRPAPPHPSPKPRPHSLVCSFLTPCMSQPATAGQVHVFSHKDNVDVYSPTVCVWVCSFYTVVL